MSVSFEWLERPVNAAAVSEELPVAVSVVVPVAERCDDLNEIYRAHAEVLNCLGCSFEFIFVIDGGYEGVEQNLESLIALGAPIQIVTLPRNFGESTAITVGFERARGDILVILSAYFHVAPEGIETVLQKVNEGYDLVVARRFPRVESIVNRVQTKCFHFLVRQLTGVKLQDISSGLKAIRRQVARETHLYGDLHRFLPMFAYQRGFRVTEVDVPQHPKGNRVRVYRPGVYIRRLLDILSLVFLFKFMKKPLRFFGLIGIGFFGSGLLLSLLLIIEKLLGLTALVERPLLILGVLLMVIGIQIGSIGLLGEIIIFTHARKIKDYTVAKVLK
jgi:glycosyltransferase involved in cell wall biosynthesis